MPLKAPAQPIKSPFDQRQSQIDANFGATLDRSMSHLKRMFVTEFAAIVRQPANQVTGFDIDEFTDQLNTEVEETIQSPYQSIELHEHAIVKRITGAIEENTKPVITILAETKARNSAAADRHTAELRQLQDELNGLGSQLKVSADGIVSELEKERRSRISFRDAEQAKVRDLEQRLRAIRLKQVELESKASHQSAEREGFDRIVKQFEEKRRNWEEAAPLLYDEGGALRQKILTHLVELRRDIGEDAIDDFTRAIDEALEIVKEEGEALKDELLELEFANRRLLGRRSEFLGTKHALTPPISTQRYPSVISEAQARLDQLRRQREESQRDLQPPETD